MSSTLPLTGDGDVSINTGTPADGKVKLTNVSSGAGKKLTIEGSNAGSGNSDGGDIVLQPGTKCGTTTVNTVDKTNKVVRAQVTHFSYYSLGNIRASNRDKDTVKPAQLHLGVSNAVKKKINELKEKIGE